MYPAMHQVYTFVLILFQMLEVAKVMSLDLKKFKSYQSELLQKSCVRYENLMSN